MTNYKEDGLPYGDKVDQIHSRNGLTVNEFESGDDSTTVVAVLEEER